MGSAALGALFLASAVNAGLPGPCILVTIARTVRGGWRAGAAVTLGILVADALLVVGAEAAMLEMLTLSPVALSLMKWAGVAALVGLAARTLLSPASPSRAAPAPAAGLSARDGAAGFALGLSSPYNLVFYLALLPQVLPTARPEMATAMALCAIILAGVAVAQAGAVVLALGCAGFAAGRRPGRWVDRVSAAFLLAFACAAALVPAGRAGVDAGPLQVSER